MAHSRLCASLFLLAAASFGAAQTVYDNLVNVNPAHIFVLYSGSESDFAAKDVAANLASRKRWKVGTTLKEKVVKLSYEEFQRAATKPADGPKFVQSFEDPNSCVVILDCAKDPGQLPDGIYAEVRRLRGPVPIRPVPDQRFELGNERAVLWSNLRAFSANSESVDTSKLTFVLASETLEDIETVKSRLGETLSDDRPPIFPDRPLEALKDYPIAVLPVRMGAIDPQLVKASGYITERLASLVSTLGMYQVERGAGGDAINAERQAQERGEFTSQDGQTLGEQMGADVVATGVIRKLESKRTGSVVDRKWEVSIELSIKLLAVRTGEVVYDTGAIRGTSRASTGSILGGLVDQKLGTSNAANDRWGGLDSDAVRAADRALKNGLFIFEMGLRDKADVVVEKLAQAYKDRGERIDWNRLATAFRKSKFAIRVPESIIRRPVPDPAVETGLLRALTRAGVDVRDQQAVRDAVDDSMVDRLLKGSIAPSDRRRMQKALGADILITGEAFAVILPRNGPNASAQARTELKVISLKTGRVLAADSMEVTQQAASEEIAGKRALEKTARVLSQSSTFWGSLAKNLEQDQANLDPVTSPAENSPRPVNTAPARLDGMSVMVALAGSTDVPGPLLRQLESGAGSSFMNSGATVLDASRAEEMKKLGVFRAIAEGSSSNYLELKAACPADVLIVGLTELTKGARGSAVQVTWKAIWMSDAKLIGTGSELGFMESADPAEMMMSSKELAGKLVSAITTTISSNKPQSRQFTVEISGLTSATQAAVLKKAVLGAFPGATTSFRAGTLRVVLSPKGLDREAIAIRLEQRAKTIKMQLTVLSSDLSSIRATIKGGGSASRSTPGPRGPALSAHSRQLAKTLKQRGVKFAVVFWGPSGTGVGSASAQELAMAALQSSGFTVLDAGVLQTRLGEDAFASLASGQLSPQTLQQLRGQYQGYTILNGLIEVENSGDASTFVRGTAVDLRDAKFVSVVPSLQLGPLPSGLPTALANQELGKRVAQLLDLILDKLGS